MTSTNNSKPCNYVFFFLLTLLAITSFGFGTYYTEARMLKEGGATGSIAQNNVAGDPTPQIPEQAPRPEVDPTKIPPVDDTDKVKGNPNAKVALIEYSDLECPYCQRFHSTVQQALEQYPDDLKWVYRHFPLQGHPDAMPRALASECVAEQAGQEGFWAFIDEIFSDQTLSIDSKAAAENLGYDYTVIESCVAEERFKEYIDAQYQGGLGANVTGTPGVVIVNTETNEAQVLPGAVDLGQVTAAIEAVLN
jgi:protein-disulfide isomerase